jgi:hypothetical protein
MLMPRTMRTSFMEGELQVEYHLTEINTPQLIKNFGTKLRITNQGMDNRLL